MKTLMIASLTLALSAAAQADSLRCNSALISENDTMSVVIQKCGEPAGRSPVTYLKPKPRDGSAPQQEIPVEEWTYGPTYGMYHYLRFEGNRLVSIASERG